MNPNPLPPQAPLETSSLTIGDLARRTGVTPATLRMWESRHGFPRPRRRDSGHRRYDEHDVELVTQVLRRRDSGMRLEKSTLLALSWAIEDECCSRAEQPMIFGGFQKEHHYRAAEERWTELARIARSTMVFAAFSHEPDPVARTTMVDLPDEAPMRREWAVVCDAPDYPAMLTAWELPGQSTVADRLRLFEAIWTVEPGAVRDAARACAQAAQQLGHPEGTPLLYELADNPAPPPIALQQAASLLNRVVAYVDRAR